MPKHQFKKGNKFSKGRTPVPGDIRSAKELLRIDFDRSVMKFAAMPIDQISEFLKEKKGTGLEMAIAACMYKAITRGENSNIAFFMDRIIGKPKQQVEVSGGLDNTLQITNEQIVSMAKEVIDDGSKEET